MRKFAFIVVLLLVGMLPIAASAQPGAPAVDVRPNETVVNVGKVAAIGVGVILGAVVMEALFAADLATLAGGIAGGVLGAWWYDGHGDTTARVSIKPTSFTAEPAGRLAASF
jgi:hypothetical protein